MSSKVKKANIHIQGQASVEYVLLTVLVFITLIVFGLTSGKNIYDFIGEHLGSRTDELSFLLRMPF